MPREKKTSKRGSKKEKLAKKGKRRARKSGKRDQAYAGGPSFGL